MAPQIPPRTAWNQRLRALVVGVLLLVGLILAVSHVGEMAQFARLAREVSPGWFLLALLLQAATYVCAAGVWYLPLRRSGVGCSLASLVPLGLAKLFSEQALPSGGVSGTALFVTALHHRGVPSEACLGTLLVSLVAYHVAFLLSASTALVLLWFHHAIQPWIALMATCFVVVTLAMLAGVALLGRWPGRPSAALRRIPRLAELAGDLERAPRNLLRDPVLLMQTSLLHGVVFLLDAATLWVVLLAIGQNTAYAVAFSSFMMATVAASIGLIPLGLGTFEATCVVMLGLLGVRLEAALTATLLLRGFTLWLPMLPGMYLARRALR